MDTKQHQAPFRLGPLRKKSSPPSFSDYSRRGVADGFPGRTLHREVHMRRTAIGLSILGAFLLSFVFMTVVRVRAHDDDRDRDARVRQGLRIAPVKLDLRGKDRELVGTGSYLVNAVGGCADCHSCPTYTPGHNPYGAPGVPPGDGQINPKNYLAGGVLFAPPGVTSAN